MHALSVFCFSAIFLLAGVRCSDDSTVGGLPKQIINELKNFPTHYSNTPKEGCRRLQPIQIGFVMYTRNNTNIPITLDVSNVKQIDRTKKVILLIHGWLSNPNSSGISELKNAYLKRYDCTVIMVDWSQMASKLYTNAYCHTSKISSYIAKFLCESKINLSELHVVAHSMGAQIAGVVGQYVTMKCKKQIGRITGLDPSGPLFQNLPERRRLDKSDAKFVDVIHTDQMKYGYLGNLGHMDFHPNCGQLQPGCSSIKTFENTTLLSDVFCSHRRSLNYMTESILSKDFVAVSCGMCPRYCRADIISEVYVIMGEDSQTVVPPQLFTKFYLRTNNTPPYAQGWKLSDAKLP